MSRAPERLRLLSAHLHRPRAGIVSFVVLFLFEPGPVMRRSRPAAVRQARPVTRCRPRASHADVRLQDAAVWVSGMSEYLIPLIPHLLLLLFRMFHPKVTGF